MPFQIVELPTGAAGEPTERKVITPPFPEREGAVKMVKLVISKFAKFGFEQEQGYWWARDANGNLRKFIIEGV